MQYLAKLKETDGVMLPTFIYRNKDLFITEFKPTCNDQWIMYMTNAEGLITKMRIKNGDLISNGLVLFLAEERKTYNAKEYYDYWTAREGKPAPFFYESRQYHVKSFMRVPGSTDLWITAERETGHWYTFRMSDNQKSKFTRHTTTKREGSPVLRLGSSRTLSGLPTRSVISEEDIVELTDGDGTRPPVLSRVRTFWRIFMTHTHLEMLCMWSLRRPRERCVSSSIGDSMR